MTSIKIVRETLGRHFQRFVELGNGVFRGERQHNGRPYAVAYVDLSDNVIERARDLHNYQERLIGADFFSSHDSLRWNSYLFFWAGPNSAANEDFQKAKRLIESDRHFARKFVLEEDELERRLGQKPKIVTKLGSHQTDAGLAWAELLRADSLAMLLEQRPRTVTLELIESGEAFEAELGDSEATPAKMVPTEVLTAGFLRKLSIQQFRQVYKEKEFSFGDVNLITAPNGTGKTSLLEAIEAFYCGRVRRDPDATVVGISGELESPDGGRQTIEFTTHSVTLKARSMAWYGRTDFHAASISEGFTRFNFLDTDAAFRLSSEQGSEQIQADLGRLIVGPDTMRLWTFLSKLRHDIDARLNAITTQQRSVEQKFNFLAEELERLEAAPSESTSLRAAFQEALAQLRPNGAIPGTTSQLTELDKSWLVALKSVVDRALAAAPVTPSNKKILHTQLENLRSAVAQARQIQSRFEEVSTSINTTVSSLISSRDNLKSAMTWERMLRASVPDLKHKIGVKEQQVHLLRNKVPNDIEHIVESIPAEYQHLTLITAFSEATSKFEQAREKLEDISREVSLAKEFEDRLVALKRDLNEASVAVMKQTRSTKECPVCKTVHSEKELAAKLQELIAFDNPRISSGLRLHINIIKSDVEKARRTEEVLKTLIHWQELTGLGEEVTCGGVGVLLRQHQKDLECSIAELQELRRTERSLIDSEILIKGWEHARANSQRALPQEGDVDDIEQLRIAIASIEQDIIDKTQINVRRKEDLYELTRDAMELASRFEIFSNSPITPHALVVAAERLLQQAEERMKAATEIEEMIEWSAEDSYEVLLMEVEACLLAYDRASRAAVQAANSNSEIELKRQEFGEARDSLEATKVSSSNLARARNTLEKLVGEHSLEDVTSEVLQAIRSQVCDVFSQIHSPPEYTLGNFEDGQLIVRRDDGAKHTVNQVSTGQRAALALSIFLALNESASTVPPVILIDDPVAHIDDLNTLSFLDYLRDLVVNSRKQVFFATADARLAALFQRKFEFLGPERFRRVNLAEPLKIAHESHLK